MKIEWLVANVTAVRAPDSAERAMYFGSYFSWAIFSTIQLVFVVGKLLCDVGTPSRALLSLLRVDVTAVASPDIAERATLGVILAGSLDI